jgi:hypothetical protein
MKKNLMYRVVHNFYEGNTVLNTNGTIVSVMKLKPLLDPNRNDTSVFSMAAIGFTYSSLSFSSS